MGTIIFLLVLIAIGVLIAALYQKFPKVANFILFCLFFVIGLLTLQVYLKRGIRARLKVSSDDVDPAMLGNLRMNKLESLNSEIQFNEEFFNKAKNNILDK